MNTQTEALQRASELVRTARGYFPRSIRNHDTFRMEVTNAAINKALDAETARAARVQQAVGILRALLDGDETQGDMEDAVALLESAA